MNSNKLNKKILLHNTLTRKKELFTPIKGNQVRMYSCGPTVYYYAHIGNLRAYVFVDILRRTLKYNGYKVKQIMNITDIGHLVSDADSGDDKMTKGLQREGKDLTLKNMRWLAEFYTKKFKEDIKALNIELPEKMLFASDYIKEDIKLIKKLEEKNFTYKIADGIYFDISKMPDYGALWGGLPAQAGKKINIDRHERIIKNLEKRNPEDFALWKFNSRIGFESPFGKGFPGWHIECSAMGIKFLGEQFDIHTGGIEHIPIHHTNEIAQSECATGKKPFVKFWLHNEWVLFGDKKMAKADDNFIRLGTLVEKNINPIAYRFWLLMANYRTKMNFNWEALEGSEVALKRLFGLYTGLSHSCWKRGKINKEYQKKFQEHINDDLNTPEALVILWDLLKDEQVSPTDKKATILDFDKVLGLGFENLKEEKIPKEIKDLAKKRETARKNKDWKKSDELRNKIEKLGYEIKDLPAGRQVLSKT